MPDYFSILSFWTVASLTCIVGIFELLPELEGWNKKNKKYKIVLFILYFGLLIFATIFLERSIFYYKAFKSDIGGSPYFDWLVDIPDLIIYILLGLLFLIFTFLFYVKVTAHLQNDAVSTKKAIIELIDMQRDELKKRDALTQEIKELWNEIRELRQLLTEIKKI